MGINLSDHLVYSVKRVGKPTAETKNLPVFRLVTAYPGVYPDNNTFDARLMYLFDRLWEVERKKPAEDQDNYFEMSCDLLFTVPPDLESYVSSLRPGTSSRDLWDTLAKWKESQFYKHPNIPDANSMDPRLVAQMKARAPRVGCRLHSFGGQAAAKTKLVNLENKDSVEFREYCDDGVLSRDPEKGPALIILRDGIYYDWCFLRRDPKKTFTRVPATLAALEQIEAGIIGQRQKAIEVNNQTAAGKYTDEALSKVRAQMELLRSR